MTHEEIEANDVVERYVLHQLKAEERRAFQEHYFNCDECFARAQAEARFIASVRSAAGSGRLQTEEKPSIFTSRWWRPALAFSLSLLLLMVLLGALWLMRERERQSIAGRQARTARGASNESSPAQAGPPAAETRQPSPRQDESARNKPTPKAGTDLIAQANAPQVLLESSRAAGDTANQIAVPATAKNLLLVIPLEPDSSFNNFELQILDRTKTQVGGILRPKPNRQGTLRVSVPAAQLPPGDYVIKLHGHKGAGWELLGEYYLRVISKP